MKIKILIIGKKSFISLILQKELKNFFIIKTVDFQNFLKIDKKSLKKFRYIINCSLNKKYITKKYNFKNDFDYIIANKIKDFDIGYILLSTRKVYKIGDNLKENSKKAPKNIYSKNKLITEKKLFSLIKKKLLILRISNLIGFPKVKSSRKIHNTFIDHFFVCAKKGHVIDNKENYKDFLSSNQFSNIIKMLIKKRIYGIFNVSIGKKVYLFNIFNWLNFYNDEKNTIKKQLKIYPQENFFLNNSKLLKTLNIKLSLTKLKKDCKRISKLYFKK